MTGLYIFIALLVVGITAMFVFRARWAKGEKLEEQIRETRFTKEREEEKAKAAARAAAKES